MATVELFDLGFAKERVLAKQHAVVLPPTLVLASLFKFESAMFQSASAAEL